MVTSNIPCEHNTYSPTSLRASFPTHCVVTPQIVKIGHTGVRISEHFSAQHPRTMRPSTNHIHFVVMLFSSSKSSRTFKPKKNIPEGTHQYDLIKHAAATLGSGNLRSAVVLPEGEDLNEWVAVNSECQRRDRQL